MIRFVINVFLILESEQNEEEIAVIPGASDEDGEIRGLMIEEEEDYRYNVPEDSSLNEAGYFALAEVSTGPYKKFRK